MMMKKMTLRRGVGGEINNKRRRRGEGAVE